MPKRWLSRRGRPQNNDSPAQYTPSNNDQAFDFAFPNPSSAAPNSSTTAATPPTRPQYEDRSKTAEGIVEGRTIKELKIVVPPIRPQSSEGNRVSIYKPSHRVSRSVDDLIGLAFGSPSHPPMAFRNLAAPLSPPDEDDRLRVKGYFNLSGKKPHIQPKSWKKIGALFRGRATPPKGKDQPVEGNSMTTQPPALETRDTYPKRADSKSAAQAPDQPTRRPPSVPPDADNQPAKREPYIEKSVLLDSTPPSSAELTGPPRKLTQRPVRMSSLPKLEVAIPIKNSSQHTVKMHNIPTASRSSSLLARRNKAVDHITASANNSHNASSSTVDQPATQNMLADDGDGILQPRRMTSPTMPKPPFASKPDSSPTVSKYSLFPPKAPTQIKIVGRVPFESPLKRSVTSPARLSPMQDHFPMTKVQPLNPHRKVSEELPVSSPEEKTASTDRTDVWSTSHSLQSSVSSSTTTEEIFFDIKSFRDSKGIEDNQQFVINRPDSAVVQLARSRSKVNAATRTHKQGSGSIGSNPQAALSTLDDEHRNKHSSVSSVNTAVFDEVIAAVEQFGTPASTKALRTKFHDGTAIAPPRLATFKSDVNMKLLPPDPGLPTRSASTPRREQLQRTMPSPVLEEVSPLSKKSLSPEKGIESGAVSPSSTTTVKPKVVSTPLVQNKKVESSPAKDKQPTATAKKSLKPPHFAAVASLKRVDTPIEDSPTIPQGPPPRKPVPVSRDREDRPPPVPEKDAKFVPISKFAAKNTMVKIEQAQAGVRPARPIRSATETLVSSSPRLNQQKYSSPKIGSRPERSATIPMPQAPQPRKPPQLNNSDFVSQSASPVAKIESKTTAAVVVAAPTAEVSVARTVSLSRKQSARVLVPGPKLAARRAAERAKDGGTDSGIDTPSTVFSVSVTNSPAIGADSPTIQPDMATSSPKIVDVNKPKEVTVRPNPLRSHPSPPSVVVTDLPAVLSTAGTATPMLQTKPLAETKSEPPAKVSEEDADKQRAREKIKKLKEQAREKIAFDVEMEEKRRDTPDLVSVRTASPDVMRRPTPETNRQPDVRISVASGDDDAESGKKEMASEASAETGRSQISADKEKSAEKEKQMISKYKEQDKTKWELIERNRALSPVVTEGERRYGHKQGVECGHCVGEYVNARGLKVLKG